MKRVVFVNRFAPPDVSATAQLIGDLARQLTHNFSVTIVAGDQDYLSAATRTQPLVNALPDDFTVVRLRASRFGRKHIAGRALDYLTFHFAALWWLLRNLRAGDVLVALTDPPLISVTAAIACKMRGAELINWVQDLFPEVALRLGQPKGLRLFAWALRAGRDWSLRRARANVAIGERMLEFLQQHGVQDTRLCLIPNWAHAEAGAGIAAAPNAMRKRLSLGDAFVVMYAGNLGRAHDAASILDAVELLRSSPSVVFLIVGDGHGNAWLRDQAQARGLENIRFEPYQPLALLGDVLAAGDLHLVTLRSELEGLIVPSKFYGIAAAARPIAFIGDTEGELARIVLRVECGFCVEQGQSKQLAEGILKLQANPAENARMGRNALGLLEQEYSRSQAIARWNALIASIHPQGRVPATSELAKE